MKENLARQPKLSVVNVTPKLTPRQQSESIIPELAEAPPQLSRPPISPEMARWLSSVGIVLLAYMVPLAWWLIPDNSAGAIAPPPAAMVVELAPAPVAPPSPPNMPPGPEQAETTPPPKPEPLPEPEPEPEIPQAPLIPKAEVVVKPKPKTEPEEKQLQEETPLEEPEETPPEDKPESAASAPPEAQQEDITAAAPNIGVSNPTTAADRKLTWQSALMLKLNETKRYPSRARRLRQEDVVYLRFTMDRDGKVLAKSIERSTQYSLLDEEALALIDRAQPLPKPPQEMPGETLEFVVPIEFFLRR